MIVDVMDINFSKLQFNRQYDAMRNKRGKNIWKKLYFRRKTS